MPVVLMAAIPAAWDSVISPQPLIGALIAMEDARIFDLQNSFIKDLSDAIITVTTARWSCVAF